MNNRFYFPHRGVSKMRFYVKMASALLLGTCLLLAYLQVNSGPDDDELYTCSAPQNETVEVNHTAGQVCQPRKSVANMKNFDLFPESLKLFLYYQHCHHFPLLLDSPGKCGGDQPVFLLMVIKSFPSNYERREVLRRTWAEEKEVQGVQIRRVFLAGTTAAGFEKMRLNKLLMLEQKQHHDIVQWDFDDTHYNLTLKQLLLMEWLHRNCPDAAFILNGDDDMFAHTANIVAFLKSLGDNDGSRHLFAGYLHPNATPIREIENKYFVPPEIYMSNRYPPFLSGGGILLSKYTAAVMHSMSKHIPLFPLDDVYLGILLAKAQLKLTSHAGIKTFGLEIPTKKVDEFDPCFYRDLLLVHRFLPMQLYIMWHQVNDPDLKCFS